LNCRVAAAPGRRAFAIDLLTPARRPMTLDRVHAAGDASPLPADEAPEEASSIDDALRALRELLAQGADRGALRAAAAQLGVSIPALEQRLSAAGTSFKNELRQARVKEAQRLLLSTVHTTTAIATQLGFPSLQHFTVEFRKLTGEAPGSWRARRS
jgi:AraC-like DNA-binding protein